MRRNLITIFIFIIVVGLWSLLHIHNNILNVERLTPLQSNDETRTIYVIMPTYYRITQIPMLTNQCNAFSFVPNLHWIIVEDSNKTYETVINFLKNCPVKFTYLYSKSPNKPHGHVKGSNQRNRGMEWLRNNLVAAVNKGVVYFADDDNTYDKRLFSEMKTLKHGATWPVGIVGGSSWEGCVTSPDDPTKIIKFWTPFNAKRKFPIDMAAFAVDLDLIFKFPNAKFDYIHTQKQEGIILEQLGFKDAFELEPKANGCSQILVWHTKTIIPPYPIKYSDQPAIAGNAWHK